MDRKGVGNGGGIDITTGSLSLTNGGRLDAKTLGQGNAGNIQVNAADSVELSGKTPNGFPSSLLASSIGTGDAGDLKVTTKQLNILNGAALIAATALGNGGNITLHVQDVLLLRNGSDIITRVGVLAAGVDGGNIDIDAQFVVAVASENSDINANAFLGQGGQVKINAQSIFGLAERSLEDLQTLLETNDPRQLNPDNLPTSDITAISQTDPSLSGQVTINTPDLDPSQGLVTLPVELVDASGLIASGCGAGGRQGSSKFIVTGRGGLP